MVNRKPLPLPVDERRTTQEILDEVQFGRDRRYIANKERKGRNKDNAAMAICGLRDPKDGFRRVNLVAKDSEKKETTVKVIKCFDIGIGANRVGEKVKALSLPRRGKGFIDYRG